MRVHFSLLCVVLVLGACGKDERGQPTANAAGPAVVGGVGDAAAGKLLDDPGGTTTSTAPVTKVVAVPAGMTGYLRGLDALDVGKWGEAVAGMEEAVGADDENANFHVGRGVALVFAEKLEPACKALERALKLGAERNTANLWLATATAMRGEFMKDATIYPFATHDLYESDVRAMSKEYGEQAFRETLAKERGENDQSDVPRYTGLRKGAIAKFPTLARAFVARTRERTPELAGVLRQRAEERVSKGDFVGARADLEASGAARGDRRGAYLTALALLNTGATDGARAILTRLLTQDPDDGLLYQARAIAAARLGSLALAKRDLEAFMRLAPTKGDLATANKEIAAAEKYAAEADAKPQAAVGELQQMAMKGAAWEELVQRAEVIVRAVNLGRLRSDDRYQERLHELHDAARAGPKNADAWASLGAFRYDEAVNVVGEAVEPRAQFRTFREQTAESKGAEVQRAELSLDRALAINPNHVRALAYKASCRIYFGQWSDAETLLKKALGLQPDDPVVLDLLADVFDHAAALKAAKATDLRSTKSWFTVDYIYYRWPSEAELARAEELAKEAEKLWEMSRGALEHAVAANRGKFGGFYVEGVLARRVGDLARAANAFEQALKLEPKHVRARQQLSVIYAQQGKAEAALLEQATATNLLHTTAAPHLKLAWMQVPRTAWTSARRAVDGAMAADAADARGAAYAGAIAVQQEKVEEAAGWFLAAAALEEVGARQRGTVLRASAGGPVNAEDVGLMLAAQLGAAQMLAQAGRHEEVRKVCEGALAVEGRIVKKELYERSVRAMLPQPVDEKFNVPEAPNPVTLLAELRLALGQALAATGKSEAALAEFAKVRAYEANKPPTVDIGGAIRGPSTRAAMAMARALVNQGKMEEARTYLLQVGRPWGLPAEVEAELKALNAEVEQARANTREAEQQGAIEAAERQRGATEAAQRKRAEAERVRQERAKREQMRQRRGG